MDERELLENYLRYICWLREYNWPNAGTAMRAVREWWREFGAYANQPPYGTLVKSHIDEANGGSVRSQLTYKMDPHFHAISDQMYAYLAHSDAPMNADTSPFSFTPQTKKTIGQCIRSLLIPNFRFLWSAEELTRAPLKIIQKSQLSIDSSVTRDWYTEANCSILHEIPFLRATSLLVCLSLLIRHANESAAANRKKRLLTQAFVIEKLDHNSGLINLSLSLPPSSSSSEKCTRYYVFVTNVVVDQSRIRPDVCTNRLMSAFNDSGAPVFAYFVPLAMSPFVLYAKSPPKVQKKMRMCLLLPGTDSALGVAKAFLRQLAPTASMTERFFHLDEFLRHDDQAMARLVVTPSISAEGNVIANIGDKKDRALEMLLSDQFATLFERRCSAFKDVLIPTRVRVMDEVWRMYTLAGREPKVSSFGVVRKAPSEEMFVNGVPSKGVFTSADTRNAIVLAPLPALAPNVRACRKIVGRVVYSLNGLLVLFERHDDGGGGMTTTRPAVKLVGPKEDTLSARYVQSAKDAQMVLGSSVRVYKRTWSFLFVDFPAFSWRNTRNLRAYMPLKQSTAERCYGDGFPATLIPVVEWLDRAGGQV